MKRLFKIPIIAALLLAPFSLAAQIPSGYVQTTATVASLANGTFGAAWTNLSSSQQLGLLGCTSTFQTTVNGNFDASGHFAVLLADTAQICPSPSTWTFTFTFSCPVGTKPGAFMVAVPVAGGGGTEDISSEINAVLPTNPCAGGGGGGGGSAPSGPAYSVQAANSTVTALTSDPAITIDPNDHTLNVGGPLPTYSAAIAALSTVPADWTFDVTTPLSALTSLGPIPSTQITGPNGSSDCLAWNGATPSILTTVPCSGAGTVTSVGVSVPSQMTVSGSPVTTAGTIALGLTTSGNEAQVVTTAGAGAAGDCATWDSSGGITDGSCPTGAVTQNAGLAASRSFYSVANPDTTPPVSSYVYHNTTGKPMIVTVSGDSGGGGFHGDVYCDSSSSPTTLVAQFSRVNAGSSAPNYYPGSVTFVVAPGYYYGISVTNGGGSPFVRSWTEWVLQ